MLVIAANIDDLIKYASTSHGLLYLHSPTLRILKEKIVGQIFQF